MDQQTVDQAAPAGAPALPGIPQRLVSLDLFRGLTIASMVMVNNQVGSGAYEQLRHRDWHGCTFTDLVFPFFLWIVGVAITLSTARRVNRGEGRGDLLRHALRRAALLFGVGLLLNGFPSYNLATIRIPGVLQRIAVCYLLATLIYLYSTVRVRVVCTLLLLGLYTVLMNPLGYEIDTNLSDTIDRSILSGHLYRPTRDPEGSVSTITALATCLLGVLAGDFLRGGWSGATTAAWLVRGGVILALAGRIFGYFQPINKPIWTASYVLWTGGLAMIVFGVCYFLADVKGWRGWWTRPWVIFGMNAMAVYVFHGMLARLFGLVRIGDASLRKTVSDALIASFGAADGSLLYSLIHVAAAFVFAWLLYRRKWFLKF